MGDALVLSESDCIEFTDNDIEGLRTSPGPCASSPDPSAPGLSGK